MNEQSGYQVRELLPVSFDGMADTMQTELCRQDGVTRCQLAWGFVGSEASLRESAASRAGVTVGSIRCGIKGYLGEQSSLMLFRFVAVDAETNRDAHDMIRWSKEKNISLETLGRAGKYFTCFKAPF